MPKVKSPGYLVGTTGNLYLSEGGVRAWVYALDRANAEIERITRQRDALAVALAQEAEETNTLDRIRRITGLIVHPDGTVTEIGHG